VFLKSCVLQSCVLQSCVLQSCVFLKKNLCFQKNRAIFLKIACLFLSCGRGLALTICFKGASEIKYILPTSYRQKNYMHNFAHSTEPD